MTLFLNNADQTRCITMADALNGMEAGMRQMSRGDAIRRPRIDNFLPTSRKDEFFCFSSMEGGIRDPGYYALRIKPDILYWKQHKDGRRRENYARGRDEVTMLANMEYGIIEGESSSSSGTQGIQFACTGGQIYEKALALGIGQVLPSEMFLQDIAT